MKKNILKYTPIVATMLLAASCASQKNATTTTTTTTVTTTTDKTTTVTTTTDKTTDKATAKPSQQFVQRVVDNHVLATDIVANSEFTLRLNGKEISVPAKLSLRKDACIRIQILMPLLRTELARVEFTPDYVLLVDRYHKEYIKASYAEVSFLANNGLSFYSLQSLFWNELIVPGAKNVKDADLKKFAVDLNSNRQVLPVTLSKGNIAYNWGVDNNTALIRNANITYSSAAHGKSTLTWNYSNFKNIGTKKFPLDHEVSLNTNYGGKNRSAQVSLQLSSPKTSSDWDAHTEISSKYRKVGVDQLLNKLTSLQ